MVQRILSWGIVPTRLVLGAVFFTAGMAKIWPDHYFPGIIGPVWLIEELAHYRLGLFAAFIAWSQILIGILLMTQRFARLAAVMLVPMLLNILMVTISQQWQGTPYIIGIFLCMNVYLLLMDFPVLRWLLSDQSHPFANNIRSNLRKDLIFFTGLFLVLLSPILAQQWLIAGISVLIFGLIILLINQFFPRP